MHPHGLLVLSLRAICGGVFELLFPGIATRVLGATPMFMLPGCRELCLWLGTINASKKVAAKNAAAPGRSLMVYPGGSAEIFTTDPNSKKTELITRTGFIRLAVEYGLDIVPGFVFGEKKAYKLKKLPRFIERFFMEQFRSPLLIFYGRFFTWLPFHSDSGLTVVFGTPIAVEQQKNPSDEYIKQLYDIYYGQMRDLFEKHRHNLGYDSDEVLVIRDLEDEKRKAMAMKKSRT